MYGENQIGGQFGGGQCANAARGLSQGMDDYASQTAGQMNQARNKPKQSQVDDAIDRLAKMTELLGTQSSSLIERLMPVLQPVPAEAKNGSGISHGSSCRIEERINDITERLRTISIALGSTREGLCI